MDGNAHETLAPEHGGFKGGIQLIDAKATLATIRETELKAAREYARMRVQAYQERGRNVGAMEAEYEEVVDVDHYDVAGSIR